MIRRLRIKFICITMAIVTVMLTVLLVGQYNAAQSSLTRLSVTALEQAAREPPDGRRPGFGKPGAEYPCFLVLLDSQGSVWAVGNEYYDLSDEQLLLEIYRAAAEQGEQTGVLRDYQLRYYRADRADWMFYAFTDISSEMETLRDLVRSSILSGALGFFTFLILSIFLANWAIRPVEQAWEQQRQFVADASHELKTPLTVILTNAELLREKSENDEQRKSSDSIVAMSRQMRDLVESMLQLARADSGQTTAEREAIDWSALLEQTLLPFEPLYFEAGLTLESRIRPDITLTGNTVQLRRVAEILLDNALKYAAPGGTVRVALESRGRECCLSVASPGVTLTARQCRDIFKRFYRVDPARRRNGSYGLGLAIAERVVSDHRGRIWAEGRDGINTFYVNLPVN
ncbi:MAG: sensor histidine kinase [Oscillospiraceae bacterium]|nr:sensor histidine kinase [Oscillospiraceae bacterium]